MILESIVIIGFAILLDLVFGDPKNRYHPTAWIGMLIGTITTRMKNENYTVEKVGGIFIVLIPVCISVIILSGLNFSIDLISVESLSILISIISGVVLFKMTIAIKGMERHALAVLDSIQKNDLTQARTNLSMIVKRNTKNLDKNHILSAVLESVSENTVDGVTGPLFYYAIFGLPGAFAYRAINTIDSMIGYRTTMFKNIGWFGAKCDTILNYLPSRLTALVMVLGALILGYNWKESLYIIRRDSRKLDSPNAGFPMAALAGALGTRLEKTNYYTIGQGSIEFTKSHITSAVTLMKVSSILFCGIVTIPIIVTLSFLGWWIHA